MNNIKVSDFGFSRTFEPGDISKTFCGSAAYAAPEILQGQPYHLPLHDIWAMGVVLYIMACASMPYDDSNIKKMVQDQLSRKVAFSKSKKVSEECKDLILMILEVNKKKRATICSILEHPWLSSMPKEEHSEKMEKLVLEPSRSATGKLNHGVSGCVKQSNQTEMDYSLFTRIALEESISHVCIACNFANMLCPSQGVADNNAKTEFSSSKS
ncbi:hypothetical protein CHS0354_029987 [Potamilus streckersoni]|uniref:Protein kinase domain-containing protein n=1 Tax=Potamilus streckersoni TaxID=2493646 RepID=A0AAE0TK12_9BIVA|nr:hypothetical protein CHS0354_029987 [Potamilus streckersoni]